MVCAAALKAAALAFSLGSWQASALRMGPGPWRRNSSNASNESKVAAEEVLDLLSSPELDAIYDSGNYLEEFIYNMTTTTLPKPRPQNLTNSSAASAIKPEKPSSIIEESNTSRNETSETNATSENTLTGGGKQATGCGVAGTADFDSDCNGVPDVKEPQLDAYHRLPGDVQDYIQDAHNYLEELINGYPEPNLTFPGVSLDVNQLVNPVAKPNCTNKTQQKPTNATVASKVDSTSNKTTNKTAVMSLLSAGKGSANRKLRKAREEAEEASDDKWLDELVESSLAR